MTWNKTKKPTALTVLQRMQLLMLRLERLSIAQQAQRTQAIIRGMVPTEKNRE